MHLRIYSFGFRKSGIPTDPTANGGGFVFDCRALHNPGRYDRYKTLTGRDPEVIQFLESESDIQAFLQSVYALVDYHVECFLRRNFPDMMVSFGCTGGQHRSVYSAEHLAQHIREKYPEVTIELNHIEQSTWVQ